MRKTLTLVTPLCVLAACQLRSFHTGKSSLSSHNSPGETLAEKVRHKYGSPVSLAAHPRHGEVDREAFLREGFLFRPKPLPPDHPMSLRLSSFATHLHKELVARFPEVAKVPAPQILILQRDELNAFQTEGKGCFKIPIQGEDTPAGSPSHSVYLDSVDGRLNSKHRVQSCSQLVSLKEDALPLFLQALNENHPNCRFRRDGEKILVNRHCDPQMERELADSVYEGLSLSLAGNLTVVYTGLLKSMEERHVHAVLAHEIAHYYRAHIMQAFPETGYVSPEYNYLYNISTQNRETRPTKNSSPELKNLEEVLRALAQEISPQIPGIKTHPQTFAILANLLASTRTLLASSLPLGEVPCATYTKSWSDFRTQGAASWPKKPWDYSPELLRAADVAASSCIASLDSISFAQLKIAMGSRQYADRLLKSYKDDLSYILGYPDVGEETTLGQMVRSFDSQKKSGDEQVRSLGTQAQAMRLGIYTVEVEADALSLPLLAFAGERPSAAPEMLLSLMGQMRSRQLATVSGFALSLEECRKGFLNSWKHGTFGNRSVVPFFGKPSEAHPSLCFRVSDTDHEIQALKLLPLGQIPSEKISWREMQVGI